MNKYAPKLPLKLDKVDPAFENISEFKELIKQNLKMVLMTNPGERVMNPEFGVGIKQMLFENFEDPDVLLEYEGSIIEQVSEYLPMVELRSVEYLSNEERNKISIVVRYSVPALELEDSLSIDTII